MEKPKLYRKRFIPSEEVFLKDDEVVICNDEIIATKWKTLKQRSDFTHGGSVYFLKRGFKVSNIYKDKELIYTYCDIIETKFNEAENKYIFSDLLVDVIIYPDGFVKVVDLAEISQALDEDLITIEQTKKALSVLDELLEIIYSGNLDELKKHL